jgi:hypothetical protein
MAHDAHAHGNAHQHDHGHDHGDHWHTHDASEPAPQATHGSINFGMIFGVFLGIVAFVVVSVVALMVGFNHVNTEKKLAITESSLAAEYRPKRERVEQDMMEAQFKVADPAKKLVQIPLSQAMDKVLAKYEGGSKELAQPKSTPAPGILYAPASPAK